MKKIILILASLFFVSCTRTVYVDGKTNQIIETRKHSGTNFINLKRIDDDYDFPDIYVDTYTNVLYIFMNSKMSAIMEADGTCLTYTEWKERNK